MIRMREKLIYKISQNRLEEIIGAHSRCTNHSMMSFGVCVEEPLMKMIEVLRALQKMFGKSSISNILPEYKIDPKEITIRGFVKKFPEGHYFIFTRGHAMALHNGKLVDTERKGIDGRQILYAFEVIGHSSQIEMAYNEYENNYSQNIFTKLKRRKSSKRTVSIDDIIIAINEIFGLFLNENDIEGIAQEMNVGKYVNSELFFTKNESTQIIDYYSDSI